MNDFQCDYPACSCENVCRATGRTVGRRAPRCLESSPACKGKVEFHLNPDRDDLKAFPRCEFHQERRLDAAERTREFRSDVPPSWFDPAYAGERWDEDD